jgi:hypothetical protein
MSKLLVGCVLGGAVFAWQNAAMAAPGAEQVATTPSLSQGDHTVLTLLGGESTTGHADQAPPKRRWYGWQTLAMDGAALGLGALALGTYDGRGTGGALLGSAAISYYALGAPALHLLRDHPGKAVASLSLRVGLPGLALGFGKLSQPEGCPASDEDDDSTRCQPHARQVAISSIVSVALASVIDHAALAWEPVPPPQRLSLAPLLGWDGARGGVAGVAGVF